MTTVLSTACTRASQQSPAEEGLAGLSPAYFGMVMATGIVSVAAHMLGLPAIARGLFYLNVGCYGVLWLLMAARLLRYPRRCFDDLIDHLRGPGYFTAVAATAVLGSQTVLLTASRAPAITLWALAILLWLGLTYAIFTGLTVKRSKPSLDKGISGGWLLAVVATQSVAVLSSLLAGRHLLPWTVELNFFAISLWLWGGVLYIWMMALIFYRYTFFRLAPDELVPSYWINMGAMAISTLAGSLLIAAAPEAPLLRSLLPFLKGITVLYWSVGSWWIPLLLSLGAWRYVYNRYPLRYDPVYWGAVFPLGMYAAGSLEMIRVLDLGFLAFLPPVFLYAALCALLATFAGLAFDLWRRLRPA